jgi:hydroxypyruvate isomerase
MLKHVAPLFEKSGITLVLEPLNILCDHMGYYLASSYEAFEICNVVGSKNIKVLYDIYHQQITEGNLIPTIRKYFDLIGHFHVADVPGRNEPGTGEINYRNVFRAIEDLGYDKYVGLEYSPTIDTAETLKIVFGLCK